MNDPAFFQAGPDGTINQLTDMMGGTNMAAIHLAKAVGGDLFLGFISAVAFATILAVVSGLTLAGASAVSHDLYASVFRRGRVNRACRKSASRKMATVAARHRGDRARHRCSSSRTSPSWSVWPSPSRRAPTSRSSFLSMFWSKLTTRGALIGGFIGLISAIVLVILGPDRVGSRARLRDGGRSPTTTRRCSR